MATEYLITNVRLPTETGYNISHVRLSGGLISSIQLAEGDVLPPAGDAVVINGTNKMLLPGFVNAHTHSVQQWGRGLVKMLPLELWLPQIIKHCDPRNRSPSASSRVVYLSSLFAGVETLLSGGTAIMDHLQVRNMEDVEAAVMAYRELGLRAFIAPMLGDEPRSNYVPLDLSAKEKNEKAKLEEESLGGLGPNGTLREEFPVADPAETERILKFWEEAVEKFHCPEEAINIAIGPVQVTSCSEKLIKGGVALRRKYGLAGHIHLLETRSQRLHSRQKFPEGGAVQWLKNLGWLDLPGTSCAHAVWLEEEEQCVMASAGAVAVHNPVANCRLGSGIAPVSDYLKRGMKVAIGCDGPCSNDGQNLLEVIKLACILSPLLSPEYREWMPPRRVVQLACEGGSHALGLQGKCGKVEEGYYADVALYDLTALSLLPRTDPISLLVLGRPSQGVGGNALHSVFVGGRRILNDGAPEGVDLNALREEIMALQPEYRDPAITDPAGDAFEVEYRGAMGLDCPVRPEVDERYTKNFPAHRVNYEADL